jgi:hypothetical protein
MPIYSELRAKRGYTKTPHHDFLAVVLRLYNGLLNNRYFPRPIVDLALFKAKIDEYAAAITATMSGAKLAFAERDSLRHEVMGMFLLLAAYVEHESHNDPSIFETSGLEAQPNKQVAHKPLDRPLNPKVTHGRSSGEILVWMPTSLRKITSCDLRYVPLNDEDAPTGEWTETIVASFLRPTTIKNLKPGTRYAFQIRSLGRLGKTDWSDSALIICV